MKAARYYGVQDIRIEDVPEPEPGPGEVKVRVAHNGVCGSDLHEYFSATTFVPTEPHPLTGASIPVVLGHEFAGTVVSVGDAVERVQVGDRVAVRPNYWCGSCAACQAGLVNACGLLAFHGLSGPGGGLSEFTVIGQSHLHLLPDGVSLELGALVEPMAVAHHAVVERSGVREGDLAVIAGLGPIGIGLWLALRARGHEHVVASDPSPERRAAVSALGARHVIDPTATNLHEYCADLTSGTGARVVFDAAGVGAAIESALPALAPRGRVVVVGIHERAMEFNPTALLMQETEIVGSLIYTDDDYTAVIDAMRGGLYSTHDWVSHASLDELPEVLNELRAGRRMKVLIDL